MANQGIKRTKWLRLGGKTLLAVTLLLLLLNFALVSGKWHTLRPGIEYQDLNVKNINPWSHIYVFRIDLEKNKLALVSAKDLDVKYASVDEYARFSKALISINGGFFDENFLPLGLRINEKRQKSPLKNISWWGVFSVENNKARIRSPKNFQRNSQMDFAIQSGPRLLVNGDIPPLKPGRAERSALGITKDGKVIILVTDNQALSTTELAQRLKNPPLNCVNALNLDGGSSSQLHAQIDSFNLSVHGFSNVSDSVIVKANP